MNLSLLQEWRNLLFKSAAICFLLTLFMSLATIGLWDTWTEFTSSWYHTKKEDLGPIIVSFFAWIKFYMLFVLLAPALAIHWTIKSANKSRSNP